MVPLAAPACASTAPRGGSRSGRRQPASEGQSRSAFSPRQCPIVGGEACARVAPEREQLRVGPVVGLRVVGAPHEPLRAERGDEVFDERTGVGSAPSSTCDVTLRCRPGCSASASSDAAPGNGGPRSDRGTRSGRARPAHRDGARASCQPRQLGCEQRGDDAQIELHRGVPERDAAAPSNQIGGSAPDAEQAHAVAPGHRRQLAQAAAGSGSAGSTMTTPTNRRARPATRRARTCRRCRTAPWACTSTAWSTPAAVAVGEVLLAAPGARGTTATRRPTAATGSASRRARPRARACRRSRFERALAHLLADGDDGRVGQQAALPVGAVDHEGVPGDEAREATPGTSPPSRARAAARPAAPAARVLSLARSSLPLISAVMSSCGNRPGTSPLTWMP